MAEKKGVWQNAAAVAVIVLGLILPFPHNGFIRNLCVSSGLVFLLLARYRAATRISFGPLAPGWFVYLGVNFLVALFADRMGYAFREYLGEFIFPFVVYLIAVNSFSEQAARRFITLFIHVGIGISLYGLWGSYQFLQRIDFRYYHEFFIMDYKAFGTFLVFVMPYVLVRARRSWYYRVLLLFLGFNLVITYCRSAWLGMFCGVVAFLTLLWLPRRAAQSMRSLLLRIAVAVLIVMALGVTAVSYSYSREGWADFTRITEYRHDHAIATRFRVMINTFGMVRDNPVWGYGLGIDNFKERYPLYKRPQDEVIWHPHNMLYRALVEGGLAGLCGLLFILGLLAAWLWQRLLGDRREEYALPLAVMLVAFLIRNLFDCHYLDDKLWTFWLLVGMTVAVAPRNRKIIILSWDNAMGTGGIARVARQLQLNFARQSVRIAVVTAQTPVAGAVSRGRHYLRLLWYGMRAVVTIGVHQPQGLIAMQWYPDGRVARLAKKIYALPYVVYAHGKEVLSSRRHPVCFRQVMADACRVIAVSRATERCLHEQGVRPDTTTVLHNGLSLPRAPEDMALAHRRKTILTVGRLVKRKGIDLLLRAAPMILQHGWQLRIVGVGPEYDNLRALAEELGVTQRVVFTGSLPDTELWQEYATAAIFVLPALADEEAFEGLGLVLLEAAAYQLPLVGTRSGGIPEIIEDGVNGLLVPAGDVDALRLAVARLTGDDKLRERLGQAARRRVRQFDWRVVVTRLAECFFEDAPAVQEGGRD